MEGKGEYTFPTGTRYVGETYNGLFHGHGVLHFPNGSKYEAKWVNGIAQQVRVWQWNQRCFNKSLMCWEKDGLKSVALNCDEPSQPAPATSPSQEQNIHLFKTGLNQVMKTWTSFPI